jgi:hypothetical protein
MAAVVVAVDVGKNTAALWSRMRLGTGCWVRLKDSVQAAPTLCGGSVEQLDHRIHPTDPIDRCRAPASRPTA